MLHEDSLHYYYDHFYPYQLIEKWLTYNGKYPLMHRELSFEFGENIVQRYVTFPSHKQMKSRMLNSENVPLKVDVGAIWTGIPTKDKTQKTIQRQFVFDFDMNDYDDVRTCCKGKTVCYKCWKMLIVAAQILKTSLKEDFGFQKLMYVFSGGRGMHIWVCDDRARFMSDQVRKCSVDYLQLVTANDKAASLLADGVFRPHIQIKAKDDRHAARQQILKGMHPHIARSLNIIRKWFDKIFQEQETLLNKQNSREVIYKILEARSKKLLERVQQRWSKCQQVHHRLWEQLCDQIDHYQKTKSGKQYPLRSHELDRKYKTITFIQQQIMLSFLYPRMDYNVSTMQNHLLKLPFSVHPSSKKLSVPLFYHQVLNFDPKTCITIDDLMKELQDLRDDQASVLLKTKDNTEKALKTRLYEYINPLIEFIKEL